MATSMAFTSSAKDDGQAEDAACVSSPFCWAILCASRRPSVEKKTRPMAAPGAPGDAAGDARQPLHRGEVDDGVQDLVELPGLDLLDHVRVVHDLARVQVQEEPDVGLGGLGHHRALVDQPEPLVLHREADGADLLEVVLHLARDLLQLLVVVLGDVGDVRAARADGVELVLEELALDLLVPGDDVAGVELAVGGILAVVAVHHGLDEQRRVLLVLVRDGQEVADPLQGDLELVEGIREVALRAAWPCSAPRSPCASSRPSRSSAPRPAP